MTSLTTVCLLAETRRRGYVYRKYCNRSSAAAAAAASGHSASAAAAATSGGKHFCSFEVDSFSTSETCEMSTPKLSWIDSWHNFISAGYAC